MKYILMCGGDYGSTPKQLLEIMGEKIICRTIRLLRAYGVEDIAISSNTPAFEGLGVPVLKHDNDYIYGQESNHRWLKAFYPMTEPVCYVFGDVYFSEDAIRQIVQTDVQGIQFFASAPPFAPNYIKIWGEPFAFKVTDPKLFFQKIEECHQYDLEGRFNREAVSWELWQVIKDTPLNAINYGNYHAINDYTCDIDNEAEAREFERRVFGV